MIIILGIIICYITVYITIWLHEFGHSFFYFLYKCKKNPFIVSVKPTLYFSTPAPYDIERVKALKKSQYIITCYGGVLMNLIMTIIMSIVIYLNKSSNFYINLLIYGFLLMNLGEFVSYMFIGNIYLVSDMQGIALNAKNLRICNLFIGLLSTIYYVYLFTILSPNIFWFILITNIIMIFCMSLFRILFTYKSSHKTRN